MKKNRQNITMSDKRESDIYRKISFKYYSIKLCSAKRKQNTKNFKFIKREAKI
jgi:hypothetical protein